MNKAILNERIQNMNLEVLISCMNQENLEIVKRSKITTDVLVVNQADS